MLYVAFSSMSIVSLTQEIPSCVVTPSHLDDDIEIRRSSQEILVLRLLWKQISRLLMSEGYTTGKLV